MAPSNGYYTKSAVLFIVFNRPDATRRVFEAIAAVQPKRLYLAADGARTGKPDDAELCTQVRAITEQITWACEVNTLFRSTNLGCKEAVSSAIGWFFEHEEEGIILEDDCLPSASFFSFCDELLERYRHDSRISMVSGSNLQQGKVWGQCSYYFSTMTLIWGWASWRRVWNSYDKELLLYSEPEVVRQLSKVLPNKYLHQSWVQLFRDLKAGKIDTWDLQFAFINYFNSRISIVPNQNLITNIGYGPFATHTTNTDSIYAAIPLTHITEPLTHSPYFVPETEADTEVLNYQFNIAQRTRDQLPRRRFKRWLKSLWKREKHQDA